ncbi:unnamed protein product (macronuclear) [Paramecium tetraurelia]|uniref:SUN domain-containing protein n=1 Tax=Paramecium tetraurelia TaxID=5888 RepID=A0E4Y6_PARTE|nr:uncharacterized protein GSPATT00023529001 [Paramecium tetraurelia]CAK90353.1 unnamed protein product [Paramecium tetraurelia]|eukprot:XP_001457750.1 hypothetical protein (macronuclear) [Paramecium tetraurelia strain d4-2]
MFNFQSRWINRSLDVLDNEDSVQKNVRQIFSLILQNGMLYILALAQLLSLVVTQDPVDKLFEFQQLMKQKTKVPKQKISEYDSSDIFSEGYITVSEQSEDEEYQQYDEISQYDEVDELGNESIDAELIIQQQKEQQRMEQQRIEQQKIEQQRIEQQRLEQQRQEQLRLEQQMKEQQLVEQQRLERLKFEQQQQQQILENEKKKKQIIEIPEQWSEDDENQVIQVPKQQKRRKQKKPEFDDHQILEVLNSAKKTKVQSLEDLEEMEKKIVKKKQKREPAPQDEFVQKVPAQNQTFIHFNNKNNYLELAPCSNNPIQQRACSLCKSEVGYQLDDDNWYMIGLQHGYKKEFLLLIEITKQSFGDSQLYLSFSSNGSACMTSDTLKQDIDVENVLQRFSGKSWRHFIKNELFALPQKLEGRSFQFKAIYQNKQFAFSDFEIKLASNLIQELKSLSKQEVSIRTNTVEFIGESLQCTLTGLMKQQNDELPFSLKFKNGESTSELLIPNCQIPLHNEILYGVSDLYFGEN